MNKNKSLFTWIIPLIFALAGTAWGNLIFLDEYLVSYRRLFASSAGFVILFLLAWLILRAVPEKERNFKPLLVWLIPVLIAVPLSLAFPGTLAYLEKHNLEITAEPGSGEVDFAGINTGNIDVPLSQVIFSREWQKTDTGYQTNSGGSITWTGRVSSHPSVIVYTGPEMGRLQVTWDGKSREYSLHSDTSAESPITTRLPVPWYLSLLYFTVSWVFFFLFLFMLFLLFRSFSLEENLTHRRGFWVKYALPFFLVSGFMLLVFFPGMMSGDSLTQWKQAHSLVFSDHHPVFHTLTILLASKIWDSPASSILFQILFLGLVFGWGMGNLVKRGLPGKVAWTVAILFALTPANLLFPVTLWKDVPYTASLFWFTLVMVEFFFSRGEWLKSPLNLAAFILSALFTSLFRHNGWPVVLLSCMVLLWFERKQFRWVLPAVAVVFVLRLLITGPFYKVLQVPPTPAKLTYTIVLYNIAAHLAAGEPVSPQTLDTLTNVLPIGEWVFDPCSVVPLQQNPKLNETFLEQDKGKFVQIALAQARQNPLPNLIALDNLGAFVYRINPNCSIYISPLAYHPASAPGAGWIDFAADGRTVESSLLPALVRPIAKFYDQTATYDAIRVFYILFWQPVVYLVLFILAITGFFFFQKRWDALIITAPPVFQSLTLALLSQAEQTRYQYGLIVISIYSIALFLWAYYDSKKVSKPKGDE